MSLIDLFSLCVLFSQDTRGICPFVLQCIHMLMKKTSLGGLFLVMFNSRHLKISG